MRLDASGVFLTGGKPARSCSVPPEAARKNTMAWQILSAHNQADGTLLRLRFDALISHDITYVGVIQQARFSGMREFPVPYALTNCHNSLCAVGGTINEDDHVYGLSAAKKYGGIYVPANQSVIHSYAREQLAMAGGMILGTDSHTRYGALGCMGIGEGGPELVKQLLRNTYDVPTPEVVLVWVTGAPRHGVGPHDVALALVRETFASSFVNNRILEFAGPGIAGLPIDYRNAIDVMTTETTCLSSIWQTDDVVRTHYQTHGRPEAFHALAPVEPAYYERMIELNLDEIEPMIALPFHPSNAWPIREFLASARDLLAAVEDDAARRFNDLRPDLVSKVSGRGVRADQGVIAGCSGGLFDNIAEAAAILREKSIGDGSFNLSVYPTSVPVSMELTRRGLSNELLAAGAILKPSFCGPCFGAGDVPAHNGLSLRHATRNFPSREGSKPGEGQLACVALMDARSIAATAANGGWITPADALDYDAPHYDYHFDDTAFRHRVYNGWGNPKPETELVMGPNITDWPAMYPLSENILLELAAVIRDEVTTTDELIPSGETSSYRSNPVRLADFALSRRVPDYVPRAKRIAAGEQARRDSTPQPQLSAWLERVGNPAALLPNTQYGSCIFANRPGDGSAREQAASCQKVLGGLANLCYGYATKRYRSNCINWGILPFTLDASTLFPYEAGDCLFVPGIRRAVEEGRSTIPAVVLCADGRQMPLTLQLAELTADERQILLDGCLMNYYKNRL